MDWIEKIDSVSSILNSLRESSHAYSEFNQNPYHLEGSGNIFEHTMMVYNEAVQRFPKDEILHLATLLHDIGKPFVRETVQETKKVTFFSHESFGVFIALEVLNKLDLSKDDIIRVLQLIQRHADAYKFLPKKIQSLYSEDEFNDLLKIRVCDMMGRIVLDTEKHKIEEKTHLDLMLLDIKDDKPVFNNEKPTCTILIGPPNSGKSTFTKNLNLPILSRDNCLTDLYPARTYSESWKMADQDNVQKEFNKRLKEIKDNNKDFVIDMTNMTIKSRKQFTQTLKNNYNLKAEVFLTSYDELLERNTKRENKVLEEHVIKTMCKRFQFPFHKEGFYEINYHI